MLKRTLVLLSLVSCAAMAQTEADSVRPILETALQTPEVVSYQLRTYLLHKVPPMPTAVSADEWTSRARSLRQQFLKNVVFHGWPPAWVDAPLKVEDLGLIPSGPGYRMRKLRYEIVPGFFSVGILYEPENMQGRVPAVLNVNGHVGAPGKSVEYKQKRCINLARRGVLNLNLEWFSCGELAHKENMHWFGAHLDLVGANNMGLFYLAMRKGLDYLYQHPSVDRERIAITGLSGGGWQTIVLSSLDERVALAVPVAGYSAITYRIERIAQVGDVEQNAPDMQLYGDYPVLTAMRAPRPTLLAYNAEDDCCFRAPLVKEEVYDQVRPFFRLYGKESAFAWHLNTDPSTHNYQLDNRLAFYGFLSRQFGLGAWDTEIPVGGELKTYDELVVGIPKDNLTILGLARKLASQVQRPAAPSRQDLIRTVRYGPAVMDHAWKLGNTHNKGLESRSYRFDFKNGLSATGVWFQALSAQAPAPASMILDDRGKRQAGAAVSDRINRGEQVLAVDLLFTGDAGTDKPRPPLYTQLLSTLGDRPLGLEAAQLIEIARWFRVRAGAKAIRLETTGFRSQVAAEVAAAIEPGLFSEIVVREGQASLAHLLDAPVDYSAAPDLFCLDLYKEFDLDRLGVMAAPTQIRRIGPLP
jgi:dienelactone hydrolase